MLKSFFAFFTHMDKQAFRAIAILVLMIISVGLLIAYGRTHLVFSNRDVLDWFTHVRGTPWAFPLTACVFMAAAFFGVPQWGLIAGAVIAFGPLYGAVFSWGATLMSASLNFWLARYLGADRLKHFGGDLMNRIARLIRNNGFVTSFTVRLVPTGPFVLVNMAAGVSHMKFAAFGLGTALGIIPKIAAIAFVGRGVGEAVSGQGPLLGVLSLGLASVCVLCMLWARSRLSSRIRPEVGTEANKLN